MRRRAHRAVPTILSLVFTLLWSAVCAPSLQLVLSTSIMHAFYLVHLPGLRHPWNVDDEDKKAYRLTRVFHLTTGGVKTGVLGVKAQGEKTIIGGICPQDRVHRVQQVSRRH